MLNRKPWGLNFTALTLSPVGMVIVIAVGALNAPGGITSVCGPALIEPPAGPIVAVVEAAGKLEHWSSPVEPSNEPIRSARGAKAAGTEETGGAAGVVGASLQDGATSKTRTRTARARTAFMSFSLKSVLVGMVGDSPGYNMGTNQGSEP